MAQSAECLLLEKEVDDVVLPSHLQKETQALGRRDWLMQTLELDHQHPMCYFVRPAQDKVLLIFSLNQYTPQ